MTTPDQPHDQDPSRRDLIGSDVLGDVVPASGGRRRGRTGLVVAAAVGVLGIAAAGVATAFALSGGGAQPEDVLPGDALAFVKLDLDPSAGQKLNAYRLAKRFPSAAGELRGVESLRDDVLRKALEGADVDYDREVKPWLGDRAGVAVLPSGGEEPAVVVAIAYTDRDKAEAALEADDSGTPLEYAFVDDYVLVSDDAAAVEAAAGADEHLSDVDAFTDAVDALEGDQVALAWGDLGRVWQAVPPEAREQVSGDAQLDGLDPSGQVVVGVQVESDAVEVLGRTVGVRTGVERQDSLATGKGTGLAGELPAEAVAVLSVAGLDESLTAAYPDLSQALSTVLPDLEAQAAELGLSLPEDLATVVGAETAVAAWGDPDAPELLLRTRSADPGAAAGVLRKAFDAFGGAEAGLSFEEHVQVRDDGLAVGTPGALGAEGQTLSSREAFTGAVPDADGAGAVLWVSLQEALDVAGVVRSPDTEPLRAVGLTATGGADGDGDFRLRVTFQ